MAKDPVCGMSVEPESAALSAEYHQQTWYFCSERCHDKFRVDPDRYAQSVTHNETRDAQESAAVSPLGTTGATEYTCPMHPEVVQDHPGSCPKCGMALEPKGVPMAVGKTEYTCPMHPEIVQDHPGSCPKCGMALEPRTVEAEEDDAELRDMSRRFWVSAVLAIPVFFSAMARLQ